jgi:hypothetical protein
MRRIVILLSVFAIMLTVSSAQAQIPSTMNSSPEPSMASGSSMASGASVSHGRGIGVGAATMLNGTSGALFTWGSSGGGFHIDGLAGLRRNPNETTSFTLGGRFWYHLHAASFADFSLGGGLGFYRWRSNPGGNNSKSHIDVSLEVGAQIRAFIVSNVALLADLGLGATFGDNDNILFGGQSVGSSEFVAGTLGIAYFFD